jgi:hypothetical protein
VLQEPRSLRAIQLLPKPLKEGGERVAKKTKKKTTKKASKKKTTKKKK